MIALTITTLIVDLFIITFCLLTIGWFRFWFAVYPVELVSEINEYYDITYIVDWSDNSRRKYRKTWHPEHPGSIMHTFPERKRVQIRVRMWLICASWNLREDRIRKQWESEDTY